MNMSWFKKEEEKKEDICYHISVSSTTKCERCGAIYTKCNDCGEVLINETCVCFTIHDPDDQIVR